MKSKTKLIFIAVIVYAAITIINQQKTLDSYKIAQAELENKIEEAKEYQEELNISKENINSLEYIEKVAREKLGMIKSDEIVFVDISGQ